MSDEREYEPRWSGNVPWCDEACRLHDGKRCMALGARPGSICEPTVAEIVKEARHLLGAIDEQYPVKMSLEIDSCGLRSALVLP
jgi:hypothetical protein